MLSPLLSPSDERDTTYSVSSDSVSLPTQVEVRPELVTTELADKLTEASLEDVVDKTQEQQRAGSAGVAPEAQAEADGVSVRAPASKAESSKEDALQDLRVFELNSDSGKSTPSNNGKKGAV